MTNLATTYRGVLESLPIDRFPRKYRIIESLEKADGQLLDVPVEIDEEGSNADASRMEMEIEATTNSGVAIMTALQAVIVAICKDKTLDRKAKLKKLATVLKQQEDLMDELAE